MNQIKFWLFHYKMTTEVYQILRALLLRKGKPTISVIRSGPMHQDWGCVTMIEYDLIDKKQKSEKYRKLSTFSLGSNKAITSRG